MTSEQPSAPRAASSLSLPELCGQLIVGGCRGKRPPDELISRLRERQLGGVILFKRNLASVETAWEFCSEVAAATPADLPPFVGVDQEGGRVTRLPEPALRLPPMRWLGDTGDVQLVQRAAQMVAKQLATIGFNIDFAPVLDVDSNPKNPVIGDRSFSFDADTVARCGSAFVTGLQSGGILACGKHFPGHGDTSKDSHTELPFVKHSKKRLDSVELVPFRMATLKGIASMMTAHVVYDQLDPGVPATLSHKILTSLLRTEIGFRGVLFSDDLEMEALEGEDIGQRAVKAVQAGCDAVLICSDPKLRERAHASLIQRAETDSAFQQRCEQAVDRALRLRRSTPPRPAPSEHVLMDVFEGEAAEVLTAAIPRKSG